MDYSRNHRLLLDLKSSQFVPMFNNEIFDQILLEQQKIKKDLIKQKSKQEVQVQSEIKYMLLKMEQMKRNKRVLLAYLNYRMDKIINAFWQNGGLISKEMQQYMHQAEKKYLDDYSKSIQDYEKTLSNDGFFDLTKDLNPPAKVYIQVRVIKNIGQIIKSDGAILDLKQGSQEYVKKSDVEQFLIDGSLEEIN